MPGTRRASVDVRPPTRAAGRPGTPRPRSRTPRLCGTVGGSVACVNRGVPGVPGPGVWLTLQQMLDVNASPDHNRGALAVGYRIGGVLGSPGWYLGSQTRSMLALSSAGRSHSLIR